MRTSTVLAWTATAAIVAGAVLFLVPVKNQYHGRTLQDCGTPAAFLWYGRSSGIVSRSNPPKGIPKSAVRPVNAHQCADQVTDRALPAGGLLAGGFVLGLVALAAAWIGHRADDRNRWQLAAQTAPKAPPPS